eukprot:gene2932-3389_t
MEEYCDQDAVNVKLSIENAAKFFGINATKDFQLEAASAALLGKDVVVAKPTGSGKSFVFQILPFAHFELQKMMGNELGITSRNVSAFRSCYGQIAKLRSLFTSPVPFIAPTATATSTTIKAISQNLELDDASYIVSIPDRSNIRYSVVKIKEECLDKMFDWLVKKLAATKFM